MGILQNLNLGGEDLQAELIPNKTEAKVTISGVSYTEHSESSGKPYLSVRLSPDPAKYPKADPIFEILSIPMEEDEPQAQKFKRSRLTDFCDCFGLDYDFDPTNEEQLRSMWEGAEGWVVVSIQDDDDYPARNKVKKYMPPSK